MPQQPPTGTDTDPLDEIEVVTAEPVIDGSGPVPARPGAAVADAAPPSGARGGALQALRASPVAVQAAAAAATGIAAGAMTTALVRAARGRRGPARTRRLGRKDGVDVLETRTYVVDVHLVGRR